MSTNDDRRRLQLLPEVLPQPRPNDGPGSPRERTLGHLQRMLTLAAASTALSGGCSNKDAGAPDAAAPTGTVDSTAATASATASASAAPSASATAAAIVDAGVDDAADASDAAPVGSAAASASAKPKRPRSGYHVVDMLPSPSRERK